VPSNPPEETVFVIAPVGGDAAAMADMLSTHGIASVICPDPGSCLAKLDHHARAMLITEDVLELPSFSQLLDCLKRQPPWSELPLIILTSGGESRVSSLLELVAAAAGSVTLLERPMSPSTLLRSVQVALRSRRRQLQVRDLLAAQERQQQQLRESEARYRALATHLPRGAAYIIDSNLRIVAAEGEALATAGLTSAHFTDKTIFEVLDPPLIDKYEPLYRGALAGQPFEDEHEAAGRWYLTRGVPMRDGPNTTVLAVAYDITDHKNAEAHLRRQALELEELNRTLDQRVRNRTAQLREVTRELAQSEHRERTRLAQMLHDGLQQILVAARMHADLLVQIPDQPRAGAGRRLIELLTEAIGATRSLTLELCPPVLQAQGLGPALEWLGNWMTEKHQLRVSLSLDPSAELEDATERLLFFQCARELLFNVVKHSGCRHANLGLRSNSDLQQLCLEVSDKGSGFHPAHLGTNCQSFGLNSIRHRLELLGGQLALHSAPGQGTRVLIWVPVKPPLNPIPAPAAGAPEPGSPLRPVPESWPADKRVRVLLVDDQQIVRDGLGEILQRQPDLDLVGQASDGIEAVDMALHLKPDVILMDFRMPRLDGLEATRRILAALPQTRVIGLSTHEEVEKALAMRHAGAVDYLTKEQPVALLLKAIRRAVGATSPATG
jgi:PAS domain S-box-containing protein